MFNVTLKNGKSFLCSSTTTIFEAAKSNGIILEHSCLSARCRSCAVRLEKGEVFEKLEDMVLSEEEKLHKWTLSCNAVPTTDLVLDVEDLGEIKIYEKRIIPAKIDSIETLKDDVIKVSLRLPPNSNFAYNSGQYVNILKGQIKRSYSIANTNQENGILTFFIKKYENGLMSNYLFGDAKVNDLLRIEGPLGSFFLRKSEKTNIIFIATGTGIAPVKAILEDLSSINDKELIDKKIWIFVGARYKRDLFWMPNELKPSLNLVYVPVLSRENEEWNGERGYVQEVVVKQKIDLTDTQVYACGSNNMINAARQMFIENGLPKNHFFSDAFVETN